MMLRTTKSSQIAPICSDLDCGEAVAPTAAPLAHLDVEAAQHGVKTEQVSDGVVYVAVQGCIGDRSP